MGWAISTGIGCGLVFWIGRNRPNAPAVEPAASAV